MKNKNKWLIVATICLLAIGFTLVSTTLTINGFITVGTNPDDIDGNGNNLGLIFTKALTDDNGASIGLINADKKSITFTTRTLTHITDSVTLYYDVSNFSKNYDVTTTVSLIDNSTYKKYYRITKSEKWVSENAGIINAGTKSDGWVKVELIDSYDGTEIPDIQFTISINAKAVERTTLGSSLVLSAPNEFANYVSNAFYATKFRYLDDVKNSTISESGIYVYDIQTDIGLTNNDYAGYIVIDSLDLNDIQYHIFMHNATLMIKDYKIPTKNLPDSTSTDIIAYDAVEFANNYGSSLKACDAVKTKYAGKLVDDGTGNMIPYVAPACQNKDGNEITE